MVIIVQLLLIAVITGIFGFAFDYDMTKLAPLILHHPVTVPMWAAWLGGLIVGPLAVTAALVLLVLSGCGVL